MAGTLIAVPASASRAIFAVLRYPNFAVAAYATVGAFAAWSANAVLGLPVVRGARHGIRDRRPSSALLPTSWPSRRLRAAGALTVAIGVDRAEPRARERRPLRLRQRMSGYDLPLDARLAFRRPAHRAAAAAEPRRSRSRSWRRCSFLATRASARRCARSPTTRPGPAQGHRPGAHRADRHVFLGMGLAGIGGMLIGLDTSIDPLTGYRVLLVGVRRRGARRARLASPARWSARCARHRARSCAARRPPPPIGPPSASSRS